MTTVPSTSTTALQEKLTDDGKVWLNGLDESSYEKNYSEFIREQIQNDDEPMQAKITITKQNHQSSCSSQVIYNVEILVLLIFAECVINI